ERHFIQRSDPRFPARDAAAFASEHLYNAARSVTQQDVIHEGHIATDAERARDLKTRPAYRASPATVAQRVLRQVAHAWSSTFAACYAWQTNPTHVLGHPQLPQLPQLPQARFIQMLTYRAELVGVQVRISEESSTSKASFLDAHLLPVYAAALLAPVFSGRRVQRGRYRATDGHPHPRSGDGAYTIVRQGASDAFAHGSSGCVVYPVRLAVYTVFGRPKIRNYDGINQHTIRDRSAFSACIQPFRKG